MLLDPKTAMIPRHVVFYTCTNSPPKNPRDADSVFIPGAKKFARVNQHCLLVPIKCDVKPSERLKQVMAVLDKNTTELESITFFCHGWRTGIQHGINTINLDKSDSIVPALSSAKHINLYCCLTASDIKDGFAARVARYTGARVFAHETKGHSYENPYAVIYKWNKIWLASPVPKDAGYTWHQWRLRLKNDVPYMFRGIWADPRKELGDVVEEKKAKEKIA